MVDVHGSFSRSCRLRIGRVGQPAEHLQIGDQRIHLGDPGGVAVEGAYLGRLAVALAQRRPRPALSGVGLAVGVVGGIRRSSRRV